MSQWKERRKKILITYDVKNTYHSWVFCLFASFTNISLSDFFSSLHHTDELKMVDSYTGIYFYAYFDNTNTKKQLTAQNLNAQQVFNAWNSIELKAIDILEIPENVHFQ